jgi:ADP-ribosylglycohydrolase
MVRLRPGLGNSSRSILGPFKFNQWCVAYSGMTHWTQISAYAGVIHANAMYYCLSLNQESFHPKLFCDLIADAIWEWQELQDQDGYDVSYLEKTDGDLQAAMQKLFQLHRKLPDMSRDEIAAEFGPGSCYVLESLPFAYAFFLKNPTFDSILEVVNAGGDTDTNAKIVGEMAGALHGFEELKAALPWAVEGFPPSTREKLEIVGHQFCDAFDID